MVTLWSWLPVLGAGEWVMVAGEAGEGGLVAGEAGEVGHSPGELSGWTVWGVAWQLGLHLWCLQLCSGLCVFI